MGIDPVTHRQKSHALSPDQLKDAANLNHMVQWEGARLEAEARLIRESKLQVPNPFQTQLDSLGSAQLVYEATTTGPLPPLPLQPLCLDVLTASQGSWLKAPTYNDFAATSSSLDFLTSSLDFSKKVLTVIVLEVRNGDGRGKGTKSPSSGLVPILQLGLVLNHREPTPDSQQRLKLRTYPFYSHKELREEAWSTLEGCFLEVFALWVKPIKH
ncbi:hypothetical protein C3L33_14776, partial [Rhododendron williamsianum]